MARLEEKFARLRHDALPPRLVLWHHCGGKVGVAVIAKCGSNAINKAMEVNPDWTRESSTQSGIEYGAIIREPVGRWASGFATYIANQWKHNRLSDEEGKALFCNEQIIARIFALVCFDVHTKPQGWFLPDAPVVLFTQEDRGEFYEWLAEHQAPIYRHDVHATATFEETSVHKTVWRQARQILEKPHCRAIIADYYRTDGLLYNYVRRHDDGRGVPTDPNSPGRN